jgi:dihydrofolate synthase/folylpolyglutamate synthase
VGLYTSPHLKNFTERIKINGIEVEQNFVVAFIEKNKQFLETEKPSFFEMTVFMAFQYFKEKKVDVAVIEVGMGGRLDSTNIIKPLVSVITNISLDHTAFLGNTLEKIAVEKAGIIKSNIPVIIGETQQETEPVFVEFAQKHNSNISFADKLFNIDYSTLSIDNKQVVNVKSNYEIVFENLKIDLLGIYQKKNVLTVLATINELTKQNFEISTENLRNGLANIVKNTQFAGRWQILGNNPLIIADTGHNYAGITCVLEQIKNTAYKKLHFIFGVVNDKDVDEILAKLPKNANYYFTQANIPRALNCNILAEKAVNFGLNGIVIPDVKTALKTAKKNAKKQDLIFVGGSTFVVAEVV